LLKNENKQSVVCIGERISEDPYKNLEWVSDKKKKNPSFQRLAAVFDLCRKDGMTQVPVQLDGACNGSQHWAAIMRDELIAELTNVLPSDVPQDLYQHVADKTTDYCKNNIEDIPWCKEFLDYWNGGIERDVTKRPTMCDSYGLTFYGIQKYIKLEGHVDWVNKEKQGGAITELARAIKHGLETSLILPNEGKEYLKTISNIASNMNKDIVYTVGIYQFSLIHDSYGCPAPDVDILRHLTREEFYAMHKENLLQRFREDVEKHLGLSMPALPTRGNLKIERVLESDYLFS
jgi:DNA-directed RNA polymerase